MKTILNREYVLTEKEYNELVGLMGTAAGEMMKLSILIEKNLIKPESVIAKLDVMAASMIKLSSRLSMENDMQD